MLEDTVFEDYLQSQVKWITLHCYVTFKMISVTYGRLSYVVLGHEEIFNINKL